ncbi:MAG: zinc ribbon domain-containing protein, partial [Spirochaetaceae bacterium]|nr:zinc ribbon domain-containing protein [Spirochaetaceae bacterium]
MFCSNCGKEIVGAANFCPGCGARIIDLIQQETKSVFDDLASVKPQAKVAEAERPSPLKLMNPLDGSTFEANLTPQQIQDLNASCESDEDCHSWIDNLEMDATRGSHIVKEVLKKLVGVTVQAGKLIFKMGKIILKNVIKIIRAFKNTIAGLIAGFVIGTIFSTIPLIGWLLGPIVIPLLTVIGGIAGFMADMSGKIHDAEIEAKIRSR